MHFRIERTRPYWAFTGQYGSLARQANEICLALGDDLLAVPRVAQRVAGDDGDADGLLGRLGRVRRPALRVGHRIEARAGALLEAHAQVDRGAAGPLQHTGDLDALVERPSIRDPLVE